ncbi:hypothetical protein PR202_ga23813 [Eleusine coracana subsp. coracana]|uniref:Sphingosine-1-phosphate lyase n=1 Tax=Eleusine coracana subsp. coracana TaxID=191504 RepID=A0AAV5D761_ELECO|nr:hypothetical protein PR202_ga23813 [Eleusine coracana subsp. coracana]
MEAPAELAMSLRAAANDRLARYEPLVLVAAPLLALLVARPRSTPPRRPSPTGDSSGSPWPSSSRLLPGVSSYIAAEKKKVVDQLQSGGSSTKSNLRAELPTVGLSEQVIKDLETLKTKDVDWQGKCSGTVYIAGSESEGHFELINKAYSMIIAESAHSAYDKAAQYFNIKVRRVPVNKYFLADVKGFKRCINGNTIMMVGSAPGFPHGLVDPIEELGELASRYDICLHVDFIVFLSRGFVLPFALTEWTGGLYVSPTIAGSRPGGLIAGAWAAMMSLGLNGYLENTSRIMEVSKKIQKGIEDIPGLYVIGKPDMTVVAFGSDVGDIFEVNDIMSSKGWHLNALQRPNSLHICVTLQHTTVYEQFLKDLQDSMDTVKANPGPISGGRAPIYGAAGKMPDRGMVRELLVEFMDSSC